MKEGDMGLIIVLVWLLTTYLAMSVKHCLESSLGLELRSSALDILVMVCLALPSRPQSNTSIGMALRARGETSAQFKKVTRSSNLETYSTFFMFIFFLQTAPEWNSTVAFVSVTAIPIDEWSLDYIRPTTVCVKKDGECLPTTFPNAFDSNKVLTPVPYTSIQGST